MPGERASDSVSFTPSAAVAAHIRRLVEGRHLLLLTDYDGTLAELAPTPADAVVSSRLRDQIAALEANPSVTFGVVSGRRLADVRQRIGSAAEFAAGLHGLEIEGPRSRFHHEALDRTAPVIDAIYRAAGPTLAWCPGILLEHKVYALTCHVRLVPRQDAARALDQFGALAAPQVQANVLRTMTAAEALELLPATDWHKGRAVTWIRTRVSLDHGAPLSVVYLGDDRTDEDAFAALGDHDVAIAVGARPSAGLVNWRLAGPSSVGRFLGHLAQLRR